MASRKQEKERLRAERIAAESDQRSQAQASRRTQLFALAAFLAIAVVAGLVVVSQSGKDSGGDVNLEGTSEVARELRGIPQSGTVLGDPGAKVSIVEFGDLQCPACREFSLTVAPQLISGPVASGDAKYEFRQRTIIGGDSVPAAKAALAAGEQGRYWQFIDLFYRNQGTENSGYVTDQFLEAIAKGAGVPNRIAGTRTATARSGMRCWRRSSGRPPPLGINATPTIMVGRETAAGTRPAASSRCPSSRA